MSLKHTLLSRAAVIFDENWLGVEALDVSARAASSGVAMHPPKKLCKGEMIRRDIVGERESRGERERDRERQRVGGRVRLYHGSHTKQLHVLHRTYVCTSWEKNENLLKYFTRLGLYKVPQQDLQSD